MDKLMAMLQKRIAGVPAWGWALVIGGAIAGYAYITKDNGAPQVAPTAPPFADDAAPSDSGDVPGTPTTPDRTVPITTNPAWIRYVTDALVGQGLYGPVEVTNALTKALQGTILTAQEAAIYNVAVRRFGAPPEGAPPITTVPVPGPTTPSPGTATEVGGTPIKLVTVIPGWRIDQWIGDIRRRYNPAFSYAMLLKLNPSFKPAKHISYGKAGSADNTFKYPMILRILA